MSEQHPRASLLPILGYTPPRLYTGKEWYVGFYAFDPATNRMRRKRIKINFITKVSERRLYAQGMIKRLNNQLLNGWNPWIESDNGKAYHKIEDVFNHYRRFIEKMFADNIYREDTLTSYLSYINNVQKWNEKATNRVNYIYQFDCAFVHSFLEHIYLERNNTPQTIDNYLMFLRTFSSWLVQNQYLKTKPTDGVVMFGKRSRKKQRTIISEGDMMNIKKYIEADNKNYMLACYILFYCFVRPKELGKIRIRDISTTRQTLFIPDENAKTRKDGTVTLPAKVIKLMIELNIFDYPSHYYLFSKNFKPGEEHVLYLHQGHYCFEQ